MPLQWAVCAEAAAQLEAAAPWEAPGLAWHRLLRVAEGPRGAEERPVRAVLLAPFLVAGQAVKAGLVLPPSPAALGLSGL